jgi:isoleucyl-tRNA synthetase
MRWCRSRERFWGEDQVAVDVLHTVLDHLCRVAAPLLPLLTEQIWGDLTGQGSVHLTDWPDAASLPADPELVVQMDLVRDIASAAKSVREARGLRRRLPLHTLTVSLADAAGTDNAHLEAFRGLLADEVNVKQVVLAPAGTLGAERFEVDLKVVGRTLGKDTPAVVQAMKAGEYEFDAAADELVVGSHRFGPGEYVRKLDADEPDATAALPGGAGLVRLDLTVTPELEAEGLVRDLAREVNEVRRKEGLDVSDRIRLVVDPGHHDQLRAAVEAHEALLTEATLATRLEQAPHDRPLADGHRVEVGGGLAAHVAVHRA